MGHPGRGMNWKALGPWWGADPLITALLKRLNFGFLIFTLTVLVPPRGVATKLMVFSDNSRGGNMPCPTQSIRYVLHKHKGKIHVTGYGLVWQNQQRN